MRAVQCLIDTNTLDGVDLVAPRVSTNAEFMAAIREACGIRLGLPATRWMLEVGVELLRTETELPLKSRWVAPTRLVQAGFTFNFDDWAGAAAALVRTDRND